MSEALSTRTKTGQSMPCRPSAASEGTVDSSGLKTPFARCGDGQAYHISRVKDRTFGPFTCLGCGDELVHRSGQYRPHFAHKPGAQCAGETALHRYAKELLERERRLFVCARSISFEALTEEIRPARLYEFDRVLIEQDFRTFRPDALVWIGDHQLAIEFRVTHEVNEEKRLKIEARDVSTMEIDLSRMRNVSYSGEDLDRLILFDAPRSWVHHRADAKEKEQLRIRVAEGIKARHVEIQKRLSKPPQFSGDSNSAKDYLASVESTGLTKLIGKKIRYRHWFTVADAEWQAAVLHHFVITPAQTYTLGQSVHVKPAFLSTFSDKLADMIRNDLNDITNDKLRNAQLPADFIGTPEAAITQYLHSLCQAGDVLIFVADRKRIEINPDFHRRLYKSKELRRNVRILLEAAGRLDWDAIWKEWSTTPIDGSHTPTDLATNDLDAFCELCRRVDRLVQMTRDYSREIPDDLCGLPLEALREKKCYEVAERARQKEEEEAKQRATRFALLEEDARCCLDDEARSWLKATYMDTGLTRLDFAGASKGNLEIMMRALHIAGNERKRRIELEAEIKGYQMVLENAARQGFATAEHAELFLNSGHPKLGGARPIEFCKSKKTLDIAQRLIPIKSRFRPR